MPTETEPERLIRDLVPVDVVLPDGGERFLRARVFVTDRRIQVWTESRPPVLAYETEIVEARLASRHESAGTPHTVATAAGDVLIRRSIGVCSCSLPNLMGLRWKQPE